MGEVFSVAASRQAEEAGLGRVASSTPQTGGQPTEPGLPGGSREERKRKTFLAAQQLVLAFGIFLIIMGGVGSLSGWEKSKEIVAAVKFISHTEAHHYAVAFHNLLLGLLFIICSIGLYVPVFWARTLTFISCFLYLTNTVILTVWEYVVRVDAFLSEAFADIIFWWIVPIIILVLLLVAAPDRKGKAT